MAWVVLVAAGLMEIIMALALKQAQGWTKLWPSVLGIAAALGSIFLSLTPSRICGWPLPMPSGPGSVRSVSLGVNSELGPPPSQQSVARLYQELVE